MDDKFGWAFIGAGGIAASVAKRVFPSGRHRLVAVYNRTREKAERLASRYGGRAYDGLESALAADGVDGVYVCTTNDAHYALCKRAIECGKPVLVEKPFTTDAERARELFALAESKGLYVCEAMWTWFSDVAHALKKRIDDGAIGRIADGCISFCMPIAFDKNGRLLRPELGGGALLDLGIYPIAYAYRLFGIPREATCSAKLACGVDVSDEIIFKYDGFDIELKASVKGFMGTGERLVINGEKGRITSGAFHSGGGFKIKSAGKTATFPSDKNAMLTQFDRVADEIRSGKTQSDFVPPQATVDVLTLLDGIRRDIGVKFPFEI